MSWKERLYLSLPYLLVLLGAAGIAVTEEVWLAIVSLVGMWFLPSPLTQPNVSRETSISDGLHFVCADCMTERDPNVSRETFTTPGYVEYLAESNVHKESDLPVPCSMLHGSAEDHVLGCEGWSFPR